ncbi:uncharacterized protein LOC142365530 isoform X2 [Opisthocomus hoazin]|uniref:uncharacterized protein LOC142365530 isoform X2 n=1 Tax=Opisthocomus hoazin TaxID=30419 RepID=UPI003F5324A5
MSGGERATRWQLPGNGREVSPPLRKTMYTEFRGRIFNVYGQSMIVTRVMESVNRDHEQCCYVPCTALPIWTLHLGTEGLVFR